MPDLNMPSLWLVSSPIAVCKFGAGEHAPELPDDQDEPIAVERLEGGGVTVVCPAGRVASDMRVRVDGCDVGWRAYRVVGEQAVLDEAVEVAGCGAFGIVTLAARFVVIRAERLQESGERLNSAGFSVFDTQ